MNWAHVHLMLNHVPVLGCIFGLFLLLMALVRGSRELMIGALWLFLLAALAAIPTFVSGHWAENTVEHLPGVTEHFIDQHEDAATVSLVGMEALGIAALASLLLIHKDRRIPRWLASLTLLLAVATAASLVWTANLGGLIRHTEIRSDQPAVSAPVSPPAD